MPGIATDLYNDLVKPRKRMILYVFLIAVFSTATYFAYTALVKPRLAFYENFGADISNDNDRPSEANLLGFFADWCPHCKTATPVWNSFTDGMKEQPTGKYLLTATTVDSSDGSDSRIQQYAINGYPTVILVKDGGQIVRFEGKITKDSLSSFVTSSLLQAT